MCCSLRSRMVLRSSAARRAARSISMACWDPTTTTAGPWAVQRERPSGTRDAARHFEECTSHRYPTHRSILVGTGAPAHRKAVGPVDEGLRSAAGLLTRLEWFGARRGGLRMGAM